MLRSRAPCWQAGAGAGMPQREFFQGLRQQAKPNVCVWGHEDGATLLSKGRDILLLNGADPAPVLSSPRSQSEKVITQVAGLLDWCLTCLPSGLLIDSGFFLQVTSQRARWKMLLFLLMCLLQGESQTARFRACTPRRKPSRLQPGGHLRGLQQPLRSTGIPHGFGASERLDLGPGRVWEARAHTKVCMSDLKDHWNIQCFDLSLPSSIQVDD